MMPIIKPHVHKYSPEEMGLLQRLQYQPVELQATLIERCTKVALEEIAAMQDEIASFENVDMKDFSSTLEKLSRDFKTIKVESVQTLLNKIKNIACIISNRDQTIVDYHESCLSALEQLLSEDHKLKLSSSSFNDLNCKIKNDVNLTIEHFSLFLPEGTTLLMVAAMRGSCRETVRFLLDHGAYVNAVNSAGLSALFYAVYYSHVDMVSMLLPLSTLSQTELPLPLQKYGLFGIALYRSDIATVELCRAHTEQATLALALRFHRDNVNIITFSKLNT